MAEALDRISDRAAYTTAGVGLAVSLAAAMLSPQDERIGAWVRLVVWHGMLKWACIIGVFAMAVLAVTHLFSRRRGVSEWARALQVVLVPVWAVAVLIGAVSAKLVWNAWNLAERRMTMSLGYTVVAAVALIVMLSWADRRVGSWSQIVTAAAMGAGLVWIGLGPAGEDVHPASAVLSSSDVAFKAYAFLMAAGCLVAILALAVPVRRWLARAAEADGAAGEKPLRETRP